MDLDRYVVINRRNCVLLQRNEISFSLTKLKLLSANIQII